MYWWWPFNAELTRQLREQNVAPRLHTHTHTPHPHHTGDSPARQKGGWDGRQATQTQNKAPERESHLAAEQRAPTGLACEAPLDVEVLPDELEQGRRRPASGALHVLPVSVSQQSAVKKTKRRRGRGERERNMNRRRGRGEGGGRITTRLSLSFYKQFNPTRPQKKKRPSLGTNAPLYHHTSIP